MQFTDEPKVSLLLHTPEQSSTETSRAIQKVLGQTLGFSETEIRAVFSQKKSVVCESADRVMVETVRSALQGVGAAVEILEQITRSDTSVTPISNSQEDLSSWYAPSLTDVRTFFDSYLKGFHATMKRINVAEVKELVDGILRARAQDKQIFIIGNGGSASLASHFATDLIKERFPDPRYLFRVSSLTDNVSVITAAGNDFGYENVFVSQLKPWLREDDVVIAISSSGNSPNILKALELSQEVGATSYGLFGFDGGKGAELADNLVHIPCKKGQYGFAEDATSLLVHVATVMIYEHDKENYELSKAFGSTV